jgi:[protein-PII] uridylyltransferase
MSAAKLRYRESFDRIRTAFLADGAASSVQTERTALVDSIVREAFEAELGGLFPSGLALLAVGGYGRKDLFPHSDVDLLLLVERAEQSSEARSAFSSFFRVLWDAGLRISHSTRTWQECCELQDRNIELNVSLLDQRLLIGDEVLYQRLNEKLPAFLKAQRTVLDRHLCRLAKERHAKFQHSIYHMEPDIKETPGGIRDLHLLWWLEGDIAPELAPARQFLATLRCLLHYEINRDTNLLTFDLQETVVKPAFMSAVTPDEYMRTYFRHARAIHAAALRRIDAVESAQSGLISQFRDWRSRLGNADFSVHRERVFFKSTHVLETEPEAGLRLFEFMARHGTRLAQDTERRFEKAAPTVEAYFAQPRAIWPQLEAILALPNAAVALRAMEDTGYLHAIFPEWRGIECLVVRDFYHRYTVDEHTLVAIQALADLRDSNDPSRQRFRDLLAETQQVALLRLALLFHDIGKGLRTGSHAIESVHMANAAMARIGVPHGAQHTVRLLIERHLDLSSLMTSRDLEDPVTASIVGQRCETLEQLKLLTLLTYADVSAVNPQAMTPWRLEQLWRVYRVGLRELTRALEDERIEPAGIPEDEADFLAGLPTRYLRTHSDKQIQSHTELARRCRALGVAVELLRTGHLWQTTVVARDRPFLFAAIAGVLASAGMNILQAEAFGNRHGEVLDTFVFADPTRTLELNPSEVVGLRATLEKAAAGTLDIGRLLKKRIKPQRPSSGSEVRPSVSVHSQLSAAATLVEVVAEDRPGLLYDLALAISLSNCNIDVVLIDTEAHKALDVFYVTSGGQKLDKAQQDSLQEQLLAVCTA